MLLYCRECNTFNWLINHIYVGKPKLLDNHINELFNRIYDAYDDNKFSEQYSDLFNVVIDYFHPKMFYDIQSVIHGIEDLISDRHPRNAYFDEVCTYLPTMVVDKFINHMGITNDHDVLSSGCYTACTCNNLELYYLFHNKYNIIISPEIMIN